MSMKLSNYCNTIYISNKHTLLYNSLSGKFVVIKNELVTLNNDILPIVSSNRPMLFSQLINAGIIINDDVNELDVLLERIKQADNNVDEFILHINPTLDCNLRCWYCYENHIRNSKMDLVVMDSIKTFIAKKITTDKNIKFFKLGFFGGEPLLFYKEIIKSIINYANYICKINRVKLYVNFTSNGILLTKDIINSLSGYSCGFQITIDGDEFYHNQVRYLNDGTGSFRTIISNILNLAENKIDVIVRINYTTKNIQSIQNILNNFINIDLSIKKYIKFDFQRVWQDCRNKRDYTETKIKDIRQIFRNNKFKVLSNYIPHSVVNSCYGDKLNHALVNYDGNVYGCTARDFRPNACIGKLNALGDIEYNLKVYNKRNNSKLYKQICRTCRIAPICGGGCKQCAYEAIDTNTCTFNYSSQDIDNIILEIFEHSFC